MKTNELIGAALDWAVAKCVGLVCDDTPKGLPSNKEYTYKPSTDWAQGGPIIERERINIRVNSHGVWYAITGISDKANAYWNKEYCSTGATPLIAAMRCFVSSKLGDEVEIPEELK